MAQQLIIDVTFPFHVLVFPAPDVPGDWIAHSLELDLIAQGTSEQHAREMLEGAVRTLIAYNVEHGLVPIQIRFAPREAWEAAGVPMPESLDITTTVRATPERSSQPFEFGDLPLSFETIVADRAPVAS